MRRFGEKDPAYLPATPFSRLMHLTFWQAARTVFGSMHLLDLGDVLLRS